jgi:hypothetical protein
MSHNRFLSFKNDTTNTANSSTFIIDAESKVLSIDIQLSDELIELPDPNLSKYDVIQYRKLIHTPRDIIFTYGGLQKAKLHFHRQQTVMFHKFKTATNATWIY